MCILMNHHYYYIIIIILRLEVSFQFLLVCFFFHYRVLLRSAFEEDEVGDASILAFLRGLISKFL